MAKYFRGEYNFNAHYEIPFKDLPPLKKFLTVLCFILWIPFAVMLFIPEMRRIGIAGLIAAFGIYLPFICMYVPGMKGRERFAPCVIITIGVLGEAGYLLAASYVESHGFTMGLLAAICCIPIFLCFFIPGIGMLIAGTKRNKKRRLYSRTVMATVVDYKRQAVGIHLSRNIAPGVNNPMDQSVVFSPIIQYYVDGQLYTGETGSYFGAGQVPALGQQTEINVDPENPNNFIMRLQSGGMLVGMGISFIAVSLLAVVIGAFVMSVI